MTYQDKANHIAELLETQLGVRGAGLEAKLQKAGRLLPRHVRREAAVLVAALKTQGNPRLARMVDGDRAVKSYKTCEKYLSGIDRTYRRRGQIISFLATNAFNMITVAALLIAVLVWRGFL